MVDENSSARGTVRRYLYDRSPSLFKAMLGVRYMGTIGLLCDSMLEAITDALRSPYTASEFHALDSVGVVAEELSIPGTSADTDATHLARIQTPWDSWAHGGSEYILAKQINLLLNYEITVERDDTFGSWSDFKVVVAEGTHPITGGGPVLGAFNLGESEIGNAQVTPEQYAGLKQLILQWKPSRWRCTYVEFVLPGGSSVYRKAVQI